MYFISKWKHIKIMCGISMKTNPSVNSKLYNSNLMYSKTKKNELRTKNKKTRGEIKWSHYYCNYCNVSYYFSAFKISGYGLLNLWPT